MSEQSVVGQRLPPIDSGVKATGEAQYSSDITLAQMLHGKVLRSPYPHALIKKIDVSRAERLPGVKAVITAADTFGVKYSVFSPKVYPELQDKQALAVDKVRHIGDEVAAVAAVDEDSALEALELIDVDYQELDAVFEPIEATEPGAPLIHEKERNISWESNLDVGDVEKGFAQADHIREDRFTTQRMSHCPLETHSCVAAFDSSGRVTIWSANQAPYRIRMFLARVLKIPESKVRVIVPAQGGGFGCRAELFPHEVCSALLSQKSSRPVKIALDREEVFSATRYRHPMIIDLKTGVTREGVITSRQSRIIVDNGAYNSTGPISAQLCMTFLHGVYRVPNIKSDSLLIYTNNQPSGPMRGHGGFQARFACDSHMDMIAEDLGIDTAELMLKNAVGPDETLAHGLKISSCGLKECMGKSSSGINWKDKRRKREEHKGVGLASHAFISGVNQDPYVCHSALVKVHEDGGISLLTGVSDCGQGCNTILSQIVAEEFGVRLEDIRFVTPDTEVTPLDRGSWSSRVTLWTGNAVKAAAADAREQLFKIIADKLEANPSDLVAKDRLVYVAGSPEKGLPIDEAIKYAQLASEGRPIIGRGHFTQPFDHPHLRSALGNQSLAYSFGSTGAEVKVDPATGRVQLLRLIISHDCGRAINPMTVEGQLQGCAVMGAGGTLTEDLIIKKGQVLSPSFLDYRMPTAVDFQEIDCAIVESFEPNGPYGAKESGEGTILSVTPAITNALYDAIGVRITDLPLTPEKVLSALEGKQIKQV
jgi:4-hydroxybenzoyl-CoA reductase subunit alpha